MDGWEQALAEFASSVGDRLRWMLVGSAATRLHGALVVPGDVDVLVHPRTTNREMVECCKVLAGHAADSATNDDLELFLSSEVRPLIASPDGLWLFGRWMVARCKLEMARIHSDIAYPSIVETMGTAVWEVRQHVAWNSWSIPVVPLEVQLATLLSMARADRVRAVRARLDERGCDHELLNRALAGRGIELHR